MKFLYFLYLLKKTPANKLFAFIRHVTTVTGQPPFTTFKKLISHFLKYNTAFLDYFYLEFYTKKEKEIKQYLDTLYMYRFHRKMNDKNFIQLFKNKSLFYKKFADFINHEHFAFKSQDAVSFEAWLNKNQPAYIISKNNTGQVGKGIKKAKVALKNNRFFINDNPLENFYNSLDKENTLLEINIEQHPVLEAFHPDSLNTVRVITHIDQDHKLNLLGTMIRIGVDKQNIDNFDAGGVSAVIDKESGIIEGGLVYKDPRKKLKDARAHPTTNAIVTGVQLPYWDELLQLIKKIVLVVPQIRTVGWDIAITPQGPALLEGNHNWDKTHWQKVYGKGMKPLLENLN